MIFSNIDFIQKPVYQFAFFLLLTAICIPFFKNRDANAIWNLAGVIYIGFIIFNSFFIWREGDTTWMYFFTSLLYSLLYIFAAGLLASTLISMLNITGSGESGMIFLAIIYHPFTLLFVIFVKWLVK